MRLAMGFVVSPLAIPLALFVVLGGASLASVRTFAASSFSGLVHQTAALSPIALIIGYLLTFFIAAPMVTWLLNRGNEKTDARTGSVSRRRAIPSVFRLRRGMGTLASGWSPD